jgi:NADH-quinone oxidoreductase subunit H
MTVDNLINWFPFGAEWPVLTFVTAVIICALPVFLFIAVYALVAIYAELKISSFMQDKVGPMGQGVGLHAWKFGILQPVADALKLILKEDIIPDLADKKLFVMAPFIVFVGAFISFAALPFGQNIIIADMNIGIFYILAVGSLSVIGIILAGWSSNNKWSLYGGMRSAAQIISYEIPAGLSIISIVMLTGTLSMQGIIEFQSGTIWGVLPNWIIFNNPFSFIAFFIFFISGVAECNRTPFDIPEAESELVAGAFTEYSGMRYAFFFLSEYAEMFVISAIAVTAFLGGWNSPISGFMNSSGWGVFWFMLKSLSLIFLMIWFRWTLPRLRVDQLMSICWKVFLPFSLVNIFGVGIWSLLVG